MAEDASSAAAEFKNRVLQELETIWAKLYFGGEMDEFDREMVFREIFEEGLVPEQHHSPTWGDLRLIRAIDETFGIEVDPALVEEFLDLPVAEIAERIAERARGF